MRLRVTLVFVPTPENGHYSAFAIVRGEAEYIEVDAEGEEVADILFEVLKDRPDHVAIKYEVLHDGIRYT